MRWEIRAPWPSRAEVERRFDELLRTRWGGRREDRPASRVIAAREIRIEMDLPGLSTEDVDVRIEGHELVIEERSAGPGPEPSEGSSSEPGRGFRHHFPLPPEWEDVSHEVTYIEGTVSVRVRARKGDRQ